MSCDLTCKFKLNGRANDLEQEGIGQGIGLPEVAVGAGEELEDELDLASAPVAVRDSLSISAPSSKPSASCPSSKELAPSIIERSNMPASRF